MLLSTTIWLWIGFNAFVLIMLAIDLGIFHRTAHTVSLKEATIGSFVWILLSLLFNAGLYFWQGPEIALQFLTAYLIEKSLSVDNIFVFVLLFTAFDVPAAYQHRVLFWGGTGGTGHARYSDCSGCSVARGLPLDSLPVRGLLDRNGHPHGLAQGNGGSS